MTAIELRLGLVNAFSGRRYLNRTSTIKNRDSFDSASDNMSHSVCRPNHSDDSVSATGTSSRSIRSISVFYNSVDTVTTHLGSSLLGA